MAGKTLYDKLWDSHEVTSPQAFEGLRLAGRKPWRVDSIIATPDHNVPVSYTHLTLPTNREV